MHSYLAYAVAQAEHRARIERAERFGHLHRDLPRRRRSPRLAVGLRTWRSRRPVVSLRNRRQSVAVLTVDGAGVESPGGGHPLSDVSLAPGAGQTVA
jgi:hypothetical protein